MMSPAAAAERLVAPQPKVSALVNARLDQVSTERQFRFRVDLDQQVTIVIAPGPSGGGEVSVIAQGQA